MKRKVLTFGKIQALGIWSKICEREEWDEEFIGGLLTDDNLLAVDEDLIPKEDL